MSVPSRTGMCGSASLATLWNKELKEEKRLYKCIDYDEKEVNVHDGFTGKK